ncbi:hypothetical protein ACS0TY_033036 [Phlomoides rotata]
MPHGSEMRTKTSILLSSLSERLQHMPAIDIDTPQEAVDQYARGCALLLLGCLMMPDSNRCSVSLLYLGFIENVARAGTYSWGSAVLADLYRELCTASQADKSTIVGALSLLQFIWEPYNFTSPDIAGLGPRCLTLIWMSQCPLINIDIVEIHHPNRVLRQFGMVQGIPPHIAATHASLHDIGRRGRVGFDWVRKHAQWIDYWRIKSLFSPTVPINGGPTMTHGYMQWYNRITRCLISPDQYTAEIQGYQPPRTSVRDVMVHEITIYVFHDNIK